MTHTHRNALLGLVLLVPAASVGTTMAMWVSPGPVGKSIYFLCKVWLLLLPLVWLRFVDREPISFSPLRRGGLGVGALTGIGIAAIILGGFWILGRGIDPAPLRGLAETNRFDSIPVYLLFAAYLTLVNSLLEEYVWRWFVYRNCEKLMPSGAAVVASGLFFTIHHIVALKSYLTWGPTLLASAGVFVGGVLWSGLYWRYRSGWCGFVSHAIIDAAVFVVGWVLLFGDRASP
jgi:hypothetical protein